VYPQVLRLRGGMREVSSSCVAVKGGCGVFGRVSAEICGCGSVGRSGGWSIRKISWRGVSRVDGGWCVRWTVRN
jgi:hypothetical protein